MRRSKASALAISDEVIRTDMYCHQCDKNFIAELDASINGQHTAECPHCGHNHHRIIENGNITEARWDSAPQARIVPARSVWKSTVLKAQTSTAAAFIRDRWLNRGDYQP